MLNKSPGQIAFDAYREKRGGVNHDKSPTPTWENLTPEIREAWEVAALAVLTPALGWARRVIESLRTALDGAERVLEIFGA